LTANSKKINFIAKNSNQEKKIEVAKMHYPWICHSLMYKNQEITRREYSMPFIEIEFKQFHPNNWMKLNFISIYEASLKSSKELFSNLSRLK